MDPFDAVRERHRRWRAGRISARAEGEAPATAFPWRGFSVGIVGVALTSFLIPYSSLYLNASQLGVDYLPAGVFAPFLLLVAANAGLRAVGAGLTRAELFLAYVTMLVPAGVSVSGGMGRLLPLLVAPFYLATSQNAWAEHFWRHIPDWLGPRDAEAIALFYAGTPDDSVPWGAWLVPLATWLAPYAAMGCVILALGIVLRRRWIERERLAFPLAQVPLALVGDDETPAFRREIVGNWVFWVAFAVPFVFKAMNGLHGYFPTVPRVTRMDPYLQQRIGELFDDPVWANLYRDVYLEIHFALIGVAMFMRKEVSLSFWFFQVVFFGLMAFFHVSGIGDQALATSARPVFGYGAFRAYSRLGAALVVAGMALWAARPAIARAWELLLRHSRGGEDGDGPLRWAIPLFVAGVGIWLLWARAFGMATVHALGMLGMGLVVFIVVARIVSEGGLIWASLSMDPINTWPFLAGTSTMSGATLTGMAYMNHVPLATRSNFLPSVMDGFKLGHSTGIRPRHVVLAIAGGLLVAYVVSAAVVLKLTYANGANLMPPHIYWGGPGWVLERAKVFFGERTGSSGVAIGTTLAGMGIMGGLVFMHRRFLWWPVYPLGYVVASAAVMAHQWFSIFLGWSVRMIVVRIGGMTGYRAMVPAALGVIAGDLVAVFLWFIVNALTGATGRTMTHHTSTW